MSVRAGITATSASNHHEPLPPRDASEDVRLCAIHAFDERYDPVTISTFDRDARHRPTHDHPRREPAVVG